MYINFLKSDFATGAGQKRLVCRHKKIIQNKREKYVHINYGIYNNKKKHKERERCKMFFLGFFSVHRMVISGVKTGKHLTISEVFLVHFGHRLIGSGGDFSCPRDLPLKLPHLLKKGVISLQPVS